jgi:hypothetical protein
LAQLDAVVLRAEPRWARRRLGMRVSSKPNSRIEPRSGRNSPVIRIAIEPPTYYQTIPAATYRVKDETRAVR